MKPFQQILGTALVLNALFVVTQAAPVGFASLIGSGEISIGDKVFGDFSFQSAQFDASSATVEATVGPSGVYYLTFRGPFVSTGAPVDININYSVRTSSGLPLITAIDQAFELSSAGTGGFVLVGETVRKDSFTGPAVAQSSLAHVTGFLNDDVDPDAEPLTGDQLSVNPAQAKVFVTKDIFFVGLPGGLIGPTAIIQSFHQVQVPEGGLTVGLMGLVLAGVGVLRQRRSF
jgi:hypothetical protein